MKTLSIANSRKFIELKSIYPLSNIGRRLGSKINISINALSTAKDNHTYIFIFIINKIKIALNQSSLLENISYNA